MEPAAPASPVSPCTLTLNERVPKGLGFRVQALVFRV